MITTLTLSNFQSHTNTTLELGTGVNTIVGATDGGKSSIIRALRLIAENKPSGTSFIHKGESQCTVTVTLDDGTSISRVRGKDTNQYEMDGDVDKALKRHQVPEHIQAKLAIDPKVNIQRQSSPYFLLHDDESTRGKLLESFCNISIASKSAANARRNALHANRRATTLTEALKPLERKLEALGDVSALVERGVELESDYKRLEATIKHYDRLKELSDKLDRISTSLPTLKALSASIDSSMNEIVKQKAVLRGIEDRIAVLSDYGVRLSKPIPPYISIPNAPDIDTIVTQYNTLLDLGERLKVKIPSKITIPSFDVAKFNNQVSTQMRISKDLVGLTSMQEELQELQVQLVNINEELAQWKYCPLCKQIIKENVC